MLVKFILYCKSSLQDRTFSSKFPSSDCYCPVETLPKLLLVRVEDDVGLLLKDEFCIWRNTFFPTWVHKFEMQCLYSCNGVICLCLTFFVETSLRYSIWIKFCGAAYAIRKFLSYIYLYRTTFLLSYFFINKEVRILYEFSFE